MNIYKEIKQSALFREMSFFLKHLGVSEDTFLDSVFNKSNTAINILRTLHNYKFFGVIIPINELLLPYFDKETRLWWDNTLSSMEGNRTVAEIADNSTGRVGKVKEALGFSLDGTSKTLTFSALSSPLKVLYYTGFDTPYINYTDAKGNSVTEEIPADTSKESYTQVYFQKRYQRKINNNLL